MPKFAVVYVVVFVGADGVTTMQGESNGHMRFKLDNAFQTRQITRQKVFRMAAFAIAFTNDEYGRRKTLEGRLQKKKKTLNRAPNPPKISYGRHWGVVRRAMI